MKISKYLIIAAAILGPMMLDCGPAVKEPLIIRFATYNVLDFSRANAFDQVASIIKNNNLDLLCFNETQPGDEIYMYNALAVAGVYMPSYQVSSMPFGTTDLDDHLMHFSKHSLSDVAEVITGSHQDPVSMNNHISARPVYRFKMTIENISIWFYSFHLKAFATDSDLEKRRAQAHALENYIMANHDLTNDYIVLLGDANTNRVEDESSTLSYLQLKFDSNPSNNFQMPQISKYGYLIPTHESSSRTLDWISLSPQLFPHYQSRLQAQEYLFTSAQLPSSPSDHTPIIFELKFDQ